MRRGGNILPTQQKVKPGGKPYREMSRIS